MSINKQMIIIACLCVKLISCEEEDLANTPVEKHSNKAFNDQAIQEEMYKKESIDRNDQLILKSEKERDQKQLLYQDIFSAYEDNASESLSQDITSANEIEEKLNELPEKSKPQSIKLALENIQAGSRVAIAISEGRFYDAAIQNISRLELNKLTPKDKKTLSSAFNTSDEDFWKVIKNDKNLAEKASHHNIPFTLKSLQSVDYNMYFRSTYARVSIDNNELLKTFTNAYQKSIVQLQWHLYGKSIEQEHTAFSSGMLSINDPNHHMFKFLDGYAELVSPKYKLHDSISFHSITTTKAYSRKSSHYEGADSKHFVNDFGIDIQNSENKSDPVLPGNKSHLLFGVRSNGMLFVKWENFGVTFNPIAGDFSVIPHMSSFLHTKGIQDNPLLERREKTPVNAIAEFKRIYKKPISKKNQELIDTYGISHMMKMLNGVDVIVHNKHAPKQFADYLLTVNKYSADSLPYRKGNEVVLTQYKKLT